MRWLLKTLIFGFASTCQVLMAERADISDELAGYIREGKVPALAAAAVLDGKIVAAGAAGVRKHGDPTRVTIDDKFHIGSCTKSMTATLAAILVAEGKIEWQTTVADVFPDWNVHPSYRGATLLQLLSNTGGAPAEFPPLLWMAMVATREAPEDEQRKNLVRTLLAAPSAYRPGSQRKYSNGGFTIAGAMLEKAAGETYAGLLEDRLFKPLGMTSAGIGAPATIGKIDQPYGHDSRGRAIEAVEPGPDADNPPAISPVGRVHLSILDLARYANFHLGGAKNSPVDHGTLQFTHAPVPPGDDYALGWVVLKRDWAGGTTLFHNGSNTMNYTVMWLAPRKKFAAVASCNIGDPAGPEACDAAITFLIKKYLTNK